MLSISLREAGEQAALLSRAEFAELRASATALVQLGGCAPVTRVDPAIAPRTD